MSEHALPNFAVVEARVAGDSGDGEIAIEAQAARDCATCAVGCLASGARAFRLPAVLLPHGLPIGHPLAIDMPGRSVLTAAAFVYGLPLACLLVGAIAGQALFGSDAAAVPGAAMGLAAGSILARRARHRIEQCITASLSIVARR